MEPIFISSKPIVAPAITHDTLVLSHLISPVNSVSTSDAFNELERINMYYSSKNRHVDFNKIMRDTYHYSNPLTTKTTKP